MAWRARRCYGLGLAPPPVRGENREVLSCVYMYIWPPVEHLTYNTCHGRLVYKKEACIIYVADNVTIIDHTCSALRVIAWRHCVVQVVSTFASNLSPPQCRARAIVVTHNPQHCFYGTGCAFEVDDNRMETSLSAWSYIHERKQERQHICLIVVY
jgi:hypothetical protein